MNTWSKLGNSSFFRVCVLLVCLVLMGQPGIHCQGTPPRPHKRSLCRVVYSGCKLMLEAPFNPLTKPLARDFITARGLRAKLNAAPIAKQLNKRPSLSGKLFRKKT